MNLVTLLRVVSAYETVEVETSRKSIIRGKRQVVLHSILSELSKYETSEVKTIYVNANGDICIRIEG